MAKPNESNIINNIEETRRQRDDSRIEQGEALSKENSMLTWLADDAHPVVNLSTPDCFPSFKKYVGQVVLLAKQLNLAPKTDGEFKDLFQLCYSCTQIADDVSLAARMLGMFLGIFQAGFNYDRSPWQKHTPDSWLKYVMKVKGIAESNNLKIKNTFYLIWLTDGLHPTIDFSIPSHVDELKNYVVQVRELASRRSPQPKDDSEFKDLFQLCYSHTQRADDVSLAARMLETSPTQEGHSESLQIRMLQQFSTQTANDISLATCMLERFPGIYQADFKYNPLNWMDYVKRNNMIAIHDNADIENTFDLIWLTDGLQNSVIDFSTKNCTDLNSYVDQVELLAEQLKIPSTDPNGFKHLFQSCYSCTQTADEVSALGDLAIAMQGKFRHIYQTDFKNDPCRWLNYVIRVKTIAETHSNSSTADFTNLLEAYLEPTTRVVSSQSQEPGEPYQLGNLAKAMRDEFPTIYRNDFRNDPCRWLDYVIKIKKIADSSCDFNQAGDYTPLFRACLSIGNQSDKYLKQAIQTAIGTPTPERQNVCLIHPKRTIEARITELEQYAKNNFTGDEGLSKLDAATTMVRDLRTETTEHFSKSEDDQRTSYRAYNMAIDTIVNDKDSPLAAHRDGGWKKLAYNVVCAVAGLGLVYGLYCFATKSNRGGSFFLSPNTESINLAEKVDDTVGHYSPGA